MFCITRCYLKIVISVLKWCKWKVSIRSGPYIYSLDTHKVRNIPVSFLGASIWWGAQCVAMTSFLFMWLSVRRQFIHVLGAVVFCLRKFLFFRTLCTTEPLSLRLNHSRSLLCQLSKPVPVVSSHFEPPCDKTNILTCAPSEDWDQLGICPVRSEISLCA